SGERDSPAEFRGIGAVLAQWMGVAVRPGPARAAVCRRRSSCRGRCRDRDRAGPCYRRAAILRTTAGVLRAARLLLRATRLLRTAELLLRAASGEPLTSVEIGAGD